MIFCNNAKTESSVSTRCLHVVYTLSTRRLHVAYTSQSLTHLYTWKASKTCLEINDFHVFSSREKTTSAGAYMSKRGSFRALEMDSFLYRPGPMRGKGSLEFMKLSTFRVRNNSSALSRVPFVSVPKKKENITKNNAVLSFAQVSLPNLGDMFSTCFRHVTNM